MELIRKDLEFEIKAVGDPGDRTLEFIGSTAHVDRYGDVIEVEGWDLKHYEKNPVFLWAHNYNVPAVGKTLKVFKTDKALVFHVYFFTDEEINAQGWPSQIPTPETVYRLYLVGGLKATSVGFQDLEREPITDKEGKQTGWRFKKQELYELSAVSVPANPYATIQQAVQRGVISECQAKLFLPPEEKGIIPFKDYPPDPEDADWNGPAEVKAAEVADLKKMCAWLDPESSDVKGSYKLPHHRADGYNTVWKGVAAAMTALLGAQGGVDLPEADRKGAYDHLAKHYAQFDKKPPEFKAYSDLDLRLIELGLAPVEDEAGPQENLEKLMGLVDRLEARLTYAQAGAITPIKFIDFDRPDLKEAVKEALKEFFGGMEKWRQAVSAALEDYLKDKEPKDYYSLALNPGQEPEGGRPAGEPDFSQLLSSTQNLHQKFKGGN